MREILEKLDNISEDRTLNPATITKRAGRFQDFLNMIKTGKPFYTVDKEPVIADPREAKRFSDMFNNDLFTGELELKLKDGTKIPFSKLLKTKELGGQASTGEEGEQLSKEAALLKPSQIKITNKDIPAVDLGNEIINNPILQSTDYGQVVIQMAKQIVNKEAVVIPKEYLNTRIGASIVDYAGEYLGILALVSGRSRFPRKEKFEEWLGGNISQLTLNFPSVSNTQLADSFATIGNDKTNHKINISSKGPGGGAAPSVSGLKVPDEIRKNPKYNLAVAFIDLADMGDKKNNVPPKYPLPNPRTISQVFQAMNLIHDFEPEAIPEEFKPFLRWPAAVVQEVTDSIDSYKKGKHVPLPQYTDITNKVKTRKGASDGGKLVYAVKEAVMRLVNEGQAIPEFQNVVLAILDMNFVQQYTDIDKKTGVVTFATQWPARLEGKITLETKSGAGDPTKGGFSFKLSNEDPKTELPPPDESFGGAKSKLAPDDEFKKTAAKIANNTDTKKRDAITKAMRPKRKK